MQETLGVASAIDVARYLLHLAWQEPEPGVTPLHIQKLLYYVQAWSLAARGQPLFREPVQAWPDGPAVRPVYGQFKKYRGSPIPQKEASGDVALSEEERAFIASVWEGYRRFSASELWRMTHSERPRQEARGALPPTAPSQAEITHEAMRQFFLAEYEKTHTPGFAAPDIAQAEREIAEGRGMPLQGALAKLRHAV
jgi:uncharacterized phage-associated protein